MIKYSIKYLALGLAIIFSLIFCALYFSFFSENYSDNTPKFQQAFFDLESKSQRILKNNVEKLKLDGVNSFWQSTEKKPSVATHIYHHDSLVYWNTNQLPILRFKTLQFPTAGFVQLQNGWYYCSIEEVNRYTVVTSFLVRQQYSYQNDALIGKFNSKLELPYEADITLEKTDGLSIFDKNDNFLFSLNPVPIEQLSLAKSIVLLIGFSIALALWLLVIFNTSIDTKLSWAFPVFLVLTRYISLEFNWMGFMAKTYIYDPYLYATNFWMPNFVAVLINLIVILFLFKFLINRLNRLKDRLNQKMLAFVLFTASYLLFFAYQFLTSSLVNDSTIPLHIEKFFELNTISIISLTCLAVFFFGYFKVLRSIVEFCKNQSIAGSSLAVYSFILGFVFLIIDIFFGYQLFVSSLFIFIFYAVVLFLVYKREKSKTIGIGLLLLLGFSIATAFSIKTLNKRKDILERELYANELAIEKTILTEIEFDKIQPLLLKDNYLKKFIGQPQAVSTNDFSEALENRLFNGYWERYEFEFFLFDDAHQLLIDPQKKDSNKYANLTAVIENSGTPSSINPNIYFIEDYTNQFSYIIRQPLTNSQSCTAELICTLKSKQIPEEIGFPRLLISSKTNVLEYIEDYSIAKYHKNRLVTKYGSFNYPSSEDIMLPKSFSQKDFFDYDNFNHFALKKSNNNIIILSSKKLTVLDLITSFSFLFSLYGLLLLPVLLSSNASKKFRNTLTLALKIQVVLIGLVFLSLLAFGWGSGIFVKNQYNEFTNDVIREKLNSVEFEIKAKLGKFDNLNIEENGNYMQYILRKFSNVFFTDINMYDQHGYLLASSRPKVFNIGLLSEQMNPVGYQHMTDLKQSQFIQQENIGELEYTSAYKPFFNGKGNLMGYINLQHFGQQREFENQIQSFLVAIINVFILLLAISVILAVLISNWLTAPLRLLQDNFSRVKFGSYNEQIEYDREDEIGSLVKDYNKKLDELEFAAQQLARSEREVAWREMAKQVAHEIKNPLTPMKLRVQQLLRVYDPNDPKSEDKLKHVSTSLIEQIDALTKIANEFSTFARMPKPNEEEINLSNLIKNVINLFKAESNIKFNIEALDAQIMIRGDKSQFIRVFNNLIKNSIQAIPKDKQGEITITLTQNESKIICEISDNGQGIKEEMHKKIFAPNFTTKTTGTGLGLAMVQQIIKNHQGDISFKSEINSGTTFTITLQKTT